MATGSITIGTSVGWTIAPEVPLALLPSCPWLLSPQQRIAPAVIAQVCERPVATATTFCRFGTATGCARLTWVPSPSCPLELLPQQTREPSIRTAQACCQCAERERASASPSTGVAARGVTPGAPSPSSPSRSSPQQSALRSASSAQENPEPATTAVAPATPGTAIGVC